MNYKKIKKNSFFLIIPKCGIIIIIAVGCGRISHNGHKKEEKAVVLNQEEIKVIQELDVLEEIEVLQDMDLLEEYETIKNID